jgi:hypothetical protein
VAYPRASDVSRPWEPAMPRAPGVASPWAPVWRAAVPGLSAHRARGAPSEELAVEGPLSTSIIRPAAFDAALDAILRLRAPTRHTSDHATQRKRSARRNATTTTSRLAPHGVATQLGGDELVPARALPRSVGPTRARAARLARAHVCAASRGRSGAGLSVGELTRSGEGARWWWGRSGAALSVGSDPMRREISEEKKRNDGVNLAEGHFGPIRRKYMGRRC